MPLRSIIIAQAPEFGLTKQIVIDNLHIYIDRQVIEVSYSVQYLSEDILVRVDKNHFTLQDYPDTIDPVTGEVIPGRKYLTEWDGLVGDPIEAGIRSWFS